MGKKSIVYFLHAPITNRKIQPKEKRHAQGEITFVEQLVE